MVLLSSWLFWKLNFLESHSHYFWLAVVQKRIGARLWDGSEIRGIALPSPEKLRETGSAPQRQVFLFLSCSAHSSPWPPTLSSSNARFITRSSAVKLEGESSSQNQYPSTDFYTCLPSWLYSSIWTVLAFSLPLKFQCIHGFHSWFLTCERVCALFLSLVLFITL